jgi:hypothetical protein
MVVAASCALQCHLSMVAIPALDVALSGSPEACVQQNARSRLSVVMRCWAMLQSFSRALAQQQMACRRSRQHLSPMQGQSCDQRQQTLLPATRGLVFSVALACTALPLLCFRAGSSWLAASTTMKDLAAGSEVRGASEGRGVRTVSLMWHLSLLALSRRQHLHCKCCLSFVCSAFPSQQAEVIAVGS